MSRLPPVKLVIRVVLLLHLGLVAFCFGAATCLPEKYGSWPQCVIYADFPASLIAVQGCGLVDEVSQTYSRAGTWTACTFVFAVVGSAWWLLLGWLVLRVIPKTKHPIPFFAAVVIALAGAAYWYFAPANPRYIVESRHAEPDRAVFYELEQYDQWNHGENIAGLRLHTRDIIYQAVYYNGVQYCFSKSGHVYAMRGSENDDPSVLIQSWNWSGQPHDFPYYSFSDTCPLVGP